jgi:hypothetical protein
MKTKFLISKFDTKYIEFSIEKKREKETERQSAELISVHDKKYERGKQILFFNESSRSVVLFKKTK